MAPNSEERRVVEEDFSLGPARREDQIEVERLSEDLRDELKITEVFDNDGLSRAITGVEVNRPGLALAGFFETFSEKQIQVLGRTELNYIEGLSSGRLNEAFSHICSFKEIPCFIVARGLKPPAELVESAISANIPIILSRTRTTEVIAVVSDFLREKFAPVKEFHGELIDVYGMGIMIIGEPAVGKSECALDLITRGHCLIADDKVYVRKKSARDLIGYCKPSIKGLVGIQGIGIFDVSGLFGVRAVRDDKRVDLVVKIEEIDRSKDYELSGLDRMVVNIMDVGIPYLLIPIVPGKSIATLIEAAAMDEILKRQGTKETVRLDEAFKSGDVK
ncbi:MAG: HPr(Ser) kinase/phosphatase [bacterium]|nr:HPr(Ser) kinase/phosphatase [bacterium]